MNTSLYTRQIIVGLIFGACVGILGATFSYILLEKRHLHASAIPPVTSTAEQESETAKQANQDAANSKTSSCIGYQLKSSFATGTNAFAYTFPDPPDDIIFAQDKNGQMTTKTDISLKQGETTKVVFAGGATGDEEIYISLDWIDSRLLSDTFLAAHLIVANGSVEEGMVQGNDPININGVTFQLKHGDLVSPTFTVSVPQAYGP